MSSSTLSDSICTERDGVPANGDASTFIYVTKLIKDHNNDAKREGDLLRCGESQNNPGHAQWNIFFFRREGHAFDTRERLIETHPLVANAGRQPAKADGDHLSSYNLGFRTKRNIGGESGAQSSKNSLAVFCTSIDGTGPRPKSSWLAAKRSVSSRSGVQSLAQRGVPKLGNVDHCVGVFDSLVHWAF